MKIGILTQPLRGNYGGVLQNWALQQILIRLGHEPITIDILPRPRLEDLFFLRSNPCFFGLFLHAGEDLRDGERGGCRYLRNL